MRMVFSLALGAALLPAQAKLTPVAEATYGKLIAGHKGKVVLIDFWATWCVPCRAEMPQLVKLSQKLNAKGLDIVMVSADEPEKEAAAAKVLVDNAAPGPFYVKHAADDDKFYAVVNPKWSGEMPAMFLYDRSGKLVKSFLGETPVKDIEAAILKLLP